MIKILQYGEGNFLRAFADIYFHTLNREGGDYGIYAIKPTPSNRSGMMELFEKQNNQYHVILRGSENGKTVEACHKAESLKKVINPFTDHASYIALASDPELKLVISNTTEAGICYHPADKQDVTGIKYESWHFRYVGRTAATEMHELGMCLEEYLAYKGLN